MFCDRSNIIVKVMLSTYKAKCSLKSTLINYFKKNLTSMFVCLMVFNATFNNISLISWRSVLLVEETRVPRENHRPLASHWQALSHNVVHVTQIEIQTHYISMITATMVSSDKYIIINNTMKNKTYHNIRTIPKSYIKIVSRC